MKQEIWGSKQTHNKKASTPTPPFWTFKLQRKREAVAIGSPVAPSSSWQQQPGSGCAGAWCMLGDYMH